MVNLPLIPPGAWDSHVHVVDEEQYPFAPNAPYRPKRASLDDLVNFEQTLGIDHVCLVGMSVYGNDNALILHSLAKLHGRARAVVSIDPETITQAELEHMHALGVRGARLNLRSTGSRLSRQEFVSRVWKYASVIGPYGWALQLFLSLDQIPLIADEVPLLGIDVVIDHIGMPADNGVPVRKQPGYQQMMSLLETGRVWVKLSGLYRLTKVAGLDNYVADLVKTAPDRIVFASDWPHTGGAAMNPNGDPSIPQDYRKVDDFEFVRYCLSLGDEAFARKLFVTNPASLWQYPSAESRP